MLNLVVIVDRDWKGEIANRLERVGRYHASRTVLCAVEDGPHTLDATATVTYEDAEPGKLGVIREQVEIDLGPEHLDALDTIVDPVLVSEMPTVLWSPARPRRGGRRAAAADRRDAARLRRPARPGRGLRARRGPVLDVYVVDLAWLRTTPWRERLAASFDLRSRLECLRAGRANSRSATRRARRPARCCWPAGWPRGWAGSRAAATRAPTGTWSASVGPRRRIGDRAACDPSAQARPGWPA